MNAVTEKKKVLLLRDDIYATLRAEILCCKLAPGSELREQQLAERFAISKSPVREALLHLQRDNLVEVVARQGYRVMPVSISDARDMYAFRAILESAAAIKIAKSASDETIASLQTHRKIPRGIQMPEVIRRNRQFHCDLFEASGSHRLAAVGRELIEQMDRMTNISMSTLVNGDPVVLLTEHFPILDALQARNGRLAAQLLRRHVGDAAKRVLKGLKQTPVTR